ncbi:HTH domain-containing protein [Candidatus Parcubacteria bacterium]|nr:HTH domain-containing protein [Candidatus Parcubacteria bacterium]
MDERKGLILNTIITEHIKTGAPVGSGALVEKYELNVSPATVRNDMMALEEEGYIIQPHTSAGRVPTEKAYHLFLESLDSKKINKSDENDLAVILNSKDEANFRETAKRLADLTGSAVFWAFHRYNVYYTGISNFLQQPEFAQINVVYDISGVIDRIDEIVDGMFDQTGVGIHTLIGAENPFGHMFGTIMAKYRLKDNIGIFGIVGPMRMDYARNLALIKYVNNVINK